MFNATVRLCLGLLICAGLDSTLRAEEEFNPKTHPLAGKVDVRLIPHVDAVRSHVSTDAQAATAIKSAHTRAVTRDSAPEQLGIRIDTAVTRDSLRAIAATGATITSTAPQWNTVCAMATVSQIDALSKIGTIGFIKLQSRGRTRQQGIANNQGDGVMQADALRTAQNLSGAGQIVGVCSDSVTDTSAVGKGTVSGSAPNAIVTNTTPQTDNGPNGTHDLPSSFQVIDFGPGGGTDEGEGMMEEIHDVAPGAALAFASSGNDQTTMATNMGLLRTAGHCTITVDDIGFSDEPFFQDGPIAQAINANYAAGVAHFSAFGNDANQAVMTVYKSIDPSLTQDDGAYPPSGNCLHDWGNGIGTFLPVTVPAGDEVSFILEWDQPYQSFNLGKGSNADLDLYLCNAQSLVISGPGKTVVGKSETRQGNATSPSGDPQEEIDYTNNSRSDQHLYLVINHFGGSRTNSTGGAGNNMRIVFDDDGEGANTTANPVGGSSISAYGHPTQVNCVAVGAIDYQAPTIPENFTSKGGNIPYYFDPSGNAAAVQRFGPDIAAPDDVDTSVFGSASDDTDRSGYPNFSGTSAAAPNAAAVGALLKQASPSMSPAQLLAALKAGATDITQAPTEDPNQPMTGQDAYTGAGLVNAMQAFANLGAIPPSSGGALSFTSQPTATPNPAGVGDTVAFSAAAAGSANLAYAWNFGDGATASGPSVSHAYTATGNYAVMLTVTDPANDLLTGAVTVIVHNPPIGTGPDSDGDGVSDSLEILAGTNPNDPNSTPVNDINARPTPLPISKLQVRLNFAHGGSDTLMLTGTLDIPEGFNAQGQRLVFDIGGIENAFTLNSKGKGSGSAGTFSMPIRSMRGMVSAQTPKFTMRLTRGNFASLLASAGLTNSTTNSPVSIPVLFIFNGIVLQTTQNLDYVARQNKTGMAR